MQNLVDLPLEDGQFTWSNNQEDQRWSRIDRFIVSPEWEESFPITFLCYWIVGHQEGEAGILNLRTCG
jgi:hypothetical protein